MSRIGSSALQVWTQVPVANRTVEVNTKTGFSLTAGSYAVLASSTQHGQVSSAATSATATISSVTTTRATEQKNGNRTNDTSIVESDTNLTLTNGTTITVGKTNSTGNPVTQFSVTELF